MPVDVATLTLDDFETALGSLKGPRLFQIPQLPANPIADLGESTDI